MRKKEKKSLINCILYRRFLFLAVVIALGTWSLALAGEKGIDEKGIDVRWESVGIGGGGGMFHPSISPYDSNLIFIACDMGGLYRSTDGARTWRMLDGYTVRKVNYPVVFHPHDSKIMYVTSLGGIKRSIDQGKTWQHVWGEFNPANPDSPAAMAIDPLRPEVIWVHFATYLGQRGHFLVRSMDGGKTWNVHPGWSYRDKTVQKIVFDPASPPEHRRVFLLADGELYRSDDDGATWKLKTGQFQAGVRHRDLAAAWNDRTKALVLYITRPSRKAKKGFEGGVYKSTDGGESWKQIIQGLNTKPYQGEFQQQESRQYEFQQYERLVLSPKNPQIVYVSSSGPGEKPSYHPTIWRTEDGGDSWKPVLFGVPSWKNSNFDPDWLTLDISWWWGGVALGLGCNPNDPNDVIFTDHGRAIRTTNGGSRWFPISSRRLSPGGDEWKGNGLEVSTCYAYYFDPHDRQRRYITYTDFGLTASLDRGDSWIWAGRGSPWTNTCYELALDPERAGVAFGAWGGAHDLPHWKMLSDGRKIISGYTGGLTKSENYCKIWKPIGRNQLPEATATTLLLDSRSPVKNRTLYAGFLNQGVYKSLDDGKSWKKKSRGLESTDKESADKKSVDNMNIWRLDLHKDGTLICAKTLAYEDGKPIPGGMYRSIDGAENWVKINQEQPLDYIFGARMDPRDSHVIYVACFDVQPEGFAAWGTQVPWPPSRGGGVFKTVDGGQSWKKVLDQPWCWDITFDPANPDIIYAGTFIGGVYRSINAGQSWQPLQGLPFVCPHRVIVDPEDSKTIYVTTFGGGVWKGRLP